MKRNWFGLRSWDRTSPNGHFLVKLQELGQNEKKEGAKLRVPGASGTEAARAAFSLTSAIVGWEALWQFPGQSLRLPGLWLLPYRDLGAGAEQEAAAASYETGRGSNLGIWLLPC